MRPVSKARADADADRRDRASVRLGDSRRRQAGFGDGDEDENENGNENDDGDGDGDLIHRNDSSAATGMLVVHGRWTHPEPWPGRRRSPSSAHSWRILAIRGRSQPCVGDRQCNSGRFGVF